MTLPNGQRVKSSQGCTPQEIRTERLPAGVRLPEKGDHWNYLTSVSASPDGKWLLVGSQAGSSTSHFEDYWLFDRTSQKWQYAGGGNDAKWSPDGSKVLWSTARTLGPLGKVHVWVVHLVLFDVRTLREKPLTSGVSYESDFHWCTLGKTAMASLRERFDRAASVKAGDLSGKWILIRNVMTQKFLTGHDGPDHVLFNDDGIHSTSRFDGFSPAAPENQLEWVMTFTSGNASDIQVKLDTAWTPAGGIERVTLMPNGDAVFKKDYGGDSAWIYRCRLAAVSNLICVKQGQENGHGLEFANPSR